MKANYAINTISPNDRLATQPNETIAKRYFNFSSGFMLALAANILWGTTFLASKFTLQAWGPFTSSALRFGIATVCLLFFLKVLKRKIEIPQGLNQWLGLLFIATTAVGVLYPMQLAGLKLISSSLSAAIMLTSPLAVLILGRLILKESLSDLPDITGPVSMLNWAIDTEVYHAKETSFARRNHPAHSHA